MVLEFSFHSGTLNQTFSRFMLFMLKVMKELIRYQSLFIVQVRGLMTNLSSILLRNSVSLATTGSDSLAVSKCLWPSTFLHFLSDLMKLKDNQDRHGIPNHFDILPNPAIHARNVRP